MVVYSFKTVNGCRNKSDKIIVRGCVYINNEQFLSTTCIKTGVRDRLQ